MAGRILRRHCSKTLTARLGLDPALSITSLEYTLSCIDLPRAKVARLRGLTVFPAVYSFFDTVGGTVSNTQSVATAVSVFQCFRKGGFQRIFNGWDSQAPVWDTAELFEGNPGSGTLVGTWTAGAQVLDAPAGDTGNLFELSGMDVDPVYAWADAGAPLKFESQRYVRFVRALGAVTPPQYIQCSGALAAGMQSPNIVTFIPGGAFSSPGVSPTVVNAEPSLYPQADLLCLWLAILPGSTPPVAAVGAGALSFTTTVMFDLELEV